MGVLLRGFERKQAKTIMTNSISQGFELINKKNEGQTTEYWLTESQSTIAA